MQLNAGMTELFAGLFVLVAIAALAIWHSPAASELLEAALHSRRDGQRAQKLAFAWYRSRFEEER